MAVIHENIFVDPSGPGGIRPNYRMNAYWQPPLDLLQILDDTRPRPIQIRSIFEHDKNIGVAEHRLCSYGFDMRRRQEISDDGIGDLIFDDAGWHSHPRRMNNDFHVGNIRQRIERNSPQRPDSYEHQEKCPRKNEKAISRTPVNPSRDHATSLP